MGKFLDHFESEQIFFLMLIVALPALLAVLGTIVAVVALLCGWQPWAR
jgi:hypothetical protein